MSYRAKNREHFPRMYEPVTLCGRQRHASRTPGGGGEMPGHTFWMPSSHPRMTRLRGKEEMCVRHPSQKNEGVEKWGMSAAVSTQPGEGLNHSNREKHGPVDHRGAHPRPMRNSRGSPRFTELSNSFPSGSWGDGRGAGAPREGGQVADDDRAGGGRTARAFRNELPGVASSGGKKKLLDGLVLPVLG